MKTIWFLHHLKQSINCILYCKPKEDKTCNLVYFMVGSKHWLNGFPLILKVNKPPL